MQINFELTPKIQYSKIAEYLKNRGIPATPNLDPTEPDTYAMLSTLGPIRYTTKSIAYPLIGLVLFWNKISIAQEIVETKEIEVVLEQRNILDSSLPALEQRFEFSVFTSDNEVKPHAQQMNTGSSGPINAGFNTVAFDTQGLVLRLINPITEVIEFGLLYSANETEVDYPGLTNPQQFLSIDSDTVGFTFGAHHGFLNYFASVSIADSDQELVKILYSPIKGTESISQGAFESEEEALAIEFSAELVSTSNWIVQPFATFFAGNYYQPEFTLSNNGSVVEEQFRQTRRLALGSRISQIIEADFQGLLIPHIHFSIVQELSDDPANGTLSRILPISGSQFVINPTNTALQNFPDPSSVQYGLGLDWLCCESSEVSFSYDSIHNNNISYNYFLFSVRVDF